MQNEHTPCSPVYKCKNSIENIGQLSHAPFSVPTFKASICDLSVIQHSVLIDEQRGEKGRFGPHLWEEKKKKKEDSSFVSRPVFRFTNVLQRSDFSRMSQNHTKDKRRRREGKQSHPMILL